MNEYEINVIFLTISIVNLIVNIATSNIKGYYWWIAPRGLMALPLFLSTTGFSMFYLRYETYPQLFGVHDEHVLITIFFSPLQVGHLLSGRFLL